MSRRSNFHDRFAVPATYTNKGHKAPTFGNANRKKFNYDEIYLKLIGGDADLSIFREVLRRLRSDYNISPMHAPNKQERDLWVKYWKQEI